MQYLRDALTDWRHGRRCWHDRQGGCARALRGSASADESARRRGEGGTCCSGVCRRPCFSVTSAPTATTTLCSTGVVSNLRRGVAELVRRVVALATFNEPAVETAFSPAWIGSSSSNVGQRRTKAATSSTTRSGACGYGVGRRAAASPISFRDWSSTSLGPRSVEATSTTATRVAQCWFVQHARGVCVCDGLG